MPDPRLTGGVRSQLEPAVEFGLYVEPDPGTGLPSLIDTEEPGSAAMALTPHPVPHQLSEQPNIAWF